MFFDDIPYFLQAAKGIADGENKVDTNGIVSFATASACGESLKPICLIPKPNATRDASGDEKLTTNSGENFEMIFVNSTIRFEL